MVNLLPEAVHAKLAGVYYARLLNVLIFLVAIDIAAGVALLLPSYFLAHGEADAAAQSLTDSQKNIDLGAQGGASGTLALIEERIQILKTYPQPPLAARVLAALSADVQKGITLTKVTITPQEGGVGTIALSGKADAPDALLAFIRALQGTALFRGIALPVSTITGGNVPFTLSFSFTVQSL
ncbi:PilN domain-containing protein [Candidatus Kaiserbacteria bacterium]|nr:PilN domain-containing protein [Candidatus Kaiserbacteria bacterium]